jgi:hypothetical protein
MQRYLSKKNAMLKLVLCLLSSSIHRRTHTFEIVAEATLGLKGKKKKLSQPELYRP